MIVSSWRATVPAYQTWPTAWAGPWAWEWSRSGYSMRRRCKSESCGLSDVELAQAQPVLPVPVGTGDVGRTLMRTINLLPPEAAQRATARRKTAGFVALGVVYLALLALAALWWQGKATDAEDDLDAQVAANTRIEAEIASLSDVRALRSTYENSVERLGNALANDVAWGRLLNDLARIIPDRLWVTSMTGTVQEDEENPFLLGQVSVTGVAFDYPDASSWLRVLDAEEWPALGGGWVSSTSRSTIGESPVVNFTSVASLLDAARSSRVEERTPEVPS